MPRPGVLTKGRSNRMIRTPGRRRVIHRKKFYKAGGTCAITGSHLQVSRGAKHDNLRSVSRSAKRPNRPYGGVLSTRALRRGIVKASRD
ncbi:MAG: eL34 family ribosomal protein [Candidatus Thorarchaeota archaeon SMTZ1-45]